jgi:TetR/AcrR family transcriptional regulator, repressor for uid operon
MNERSFIVPLMPPHSPDTGLDRRQQILNAAFVSFAKRGFHQASMHDISAEAGISVGLIYRYFENKEDVITAMAAARKQMLQELLERARQAPTLLEALEIMFTSHCCESSPQLQSAFVLDLYTEASRNPRLADLVRDITTTAMNGVTELVARAPEAQHASHGLSPRELVDLIFATSRGMLMRDVLEVERDPDKRREIQLKVVRSLWHLLFNVETTPVYA